MSKWLLRGVAFAVAMVVVRLVQGAAIGIWETRTVLVSLLLLALYGLGALAWGLLDGRADAKRNPDPDRRADLSMAWLLGGVAAGVLSGLVSWIIALFVPAIYTGGLFSEVTVFAAFTALLTFFTAMIGVLVGRWLVDRSAPEQTAEDRADTDVFDAVRDPDTDPDTDALRQSDTDAVRQSDTDAARPSDPGTEQTRPTPAQS